MATAEFTAILSAAGVPAACRWYAIADAAQQHDLPGALATTGMSRSLLGASDDSPLAAQSPHLVALPAPDPRLKPWLRIERQAPRSPCVTVLASPLGFDELFTHLKRFTDVFLPDGDDMVFAFWDPAILGTLLGQADDTTLHVRGPVLSAAQRAALLRGIDGWWYWDREGQLHSIAAVPANGEDAAEVPFKLTQVQVDALVEASVPDHVLHYIELNQPHLLQDTPHEQRYGVTCAHLLHAREVGLQGMGDLVNFVCAGFIYGEALRNDPAITSALQNVHAGKCSFDQAMEQFP